MQNVSYRVFIIQKFPDYSSFLSLGPNWRWWRNWRSWSTWNYGKWFSISLPVKMIESFYQWMSILCSPLMLHLYVSTAGKWWTSWELWSPGRQRRSCENVDFNSLLCTRKPKSALLGKTLHAGPRYFRFREKILKFKTCHFFSSLIPFDIGVFFFQAKGVHSFVICWVFILFIVCKGCLYVLFGSTEIRTWYYKKTNGHVVHLCNMQYSHYRVPSNNLKVYTM